jgi:hypothetical protein
MTDREQRQPMIETPMGSGLRKTRAYRIWIGMRQRCRNQNYHDYPNYGGRGITICERWARFEDFIADMGECPPGLTLDRIDNDGNYELGNVRNVTINGRTQILIDWVRELGIDSGTLSYRLNHGLPPLPTCVWSSL